MKIASKLEHSTTENPLLRMTAGNHPVRQAKAVVLGMLLPATVYGVGLDWNVRRPQLVLHCDSPAFSELVNDLHADDSGTAVGVMNLRHPDGYAMLHVGYENEKQGLWMCMNPATVLGRAMLQDWQAHNNMHISFLSNNRDFSSRQRVTNSMLGKQLALQSRSKPIDKAVQSRAQFAKEMGARLAVMNVVAESWDEKPRLFVMMCERSAIAPGAARTMH
jgi:hypothetical protein